MRAYFFQYLNACVLLPCQVLAALIRAILLKCMADNSDERWPQRGSAHAPCCRHAAVHGCRKGPSLLEHPFLVAAVMRLIARVTKLCWFESDVHRQIVADAKEFLQKGTVEHYRLGLLLLRAVVQVRIIALHDFDIFWTCRMYC